MRANRESNMSCPDADTSGQLAAEHTASRRPGQQYYNVTSTGSVAGQIVPSPHCRTVAAEWLSTACNTQSLTLDCTPGKGRHHTSTQARWVGLGQRGDRKTPVTLSQGSRGLGPKSDASDLQ